MATIQEVIEQSPGSTVTTQGQIVFIRPFAGPPEGAFLGLRDETGGVRLLCSKSVLPLLMGSVRAGQRRATDRINLRVGDTVRVEGLRQDSKLENPVIETTSLTVVERRAPVVIHLVTQRDQPYGSTRKCCERCGVMTIPPSQVMWTDDVEEFADKQGLREIGLIACDTLV